MRSPSEVVLLRQLTDELGRTGLMLGVMPGSPNDPEHPAWFVARRVTATFDRDGAIRTNAPVILTALSLEQLVQQLEALPNHTMTSFLETSV